MFCFKNFKKSKKFYNSIFGNLLVNQASHEALVASLLKRFRDSLASEYPSHKKHLENFKKFLGFGHFLDFVMSRSSSCKLT